MTKEKDLALRQGLYWRTPRGGAKSSVSQTSRNAPALGTLDAGRRDGGCGWRCGRSRRCVDTWHCDIAEDAIGIVGRTATSDTDGIRTGIVGTTSCGTTTRVMTRRHVQDMPHDHAELGIRTGNRELDEFKRFFRIETTIHPMFRLNRHRPVDADKRQSQERYIGVTLERRDFVPRTTLGHLACLKASGAKRCRQSGCIHEGHEPALVGIVDGNRSAVVVTNVAIGGRCGRLGVATLTAGCAGGGLGVATRCVGAGDAGSDTNSRGRQFGVQLGVATFTALATLTASATVTAVVDGAGIGLATAVVRMTGAFLGFPLAQLFGGLVAHTVPLIGNLADVVGLSPPIAVVAGVVAAHPVTSEGDGGGRHEGDRGCYDEFLHHLLFSFRERLVVQKTKKVLLLQRG